MAKLGQVSEYIQELIDKISNESGLVHVMEIQAFCTSSAKKVIDVKRCPPLGESVAQRDSVVCIIVYEQAFERLTEEQQEILMRDAFANIRYDNEKDKIIIGAPQVVVTCDGRAKFGDKLIDAAECAVFAIQQIVDEEKVEKERLKAERAEKRRQKGQEK